MGIVPGKIAKFKKKSLTAKDISLKMMPVEEYAQTISESMILAHLYGRMAANDEMGSAIAESQKLKVENKNFAEEPIPTAYDKALELMLAKNVITSEQFAKLSKDIRKYAFTVANVDSERLLNALRDNLTEAIESGALNVEDWLLNVGSVFETQGMTKLADYHLRTIFRTNIQTALNEGRRQIIQEASDDEFPLMEFVAIEDNRVRHSHLALNGFRAPKNDAIWKQITPPLDYNCRCTLRPVHKDEGLSATEETPDLNDFGFVKN